MILFIQRKNARVCLNLRIIADKLIIFMKKQQLRRKS